MKTSTFIQTPVNTVLLLGALAACTRVPSSARDHTEVVPTMMPQLAAESALAATIDSAAADVRLQDLMLVQTENLGDESEDDLLLAQIPQ